MIVCGWAMCIRIQCANNALVVNGVFFHDPFIIEDCHIIVRSHTGNDYTHLNTTFKSDASDPNFFIIHAKRQKGTQIMLHVADPIINDIECVLARRRSLLLCAGACTI